VGPVADDGELVREGAVGVVVVAPCSVGIAAGVAAREVAAGEELGKNPPN
jgi:hypothetical protein